MPLRATAILNLVVALGLGTSTAAASPWSASTANAPAQSSAKKVGSQVQVTGISSGVSGGVSSQNGKCERGRLASLIHFVDGSFEELDREKTTRQGEFNLEGTLVPGDTYLVGVGKKTITKFRVGRKPKKTICVQTESDTFVP